MKKCPICGREYTDDVIHCLADNELLSGAEIQSAARPPVLSGIPARPAPDLRLSDRQMRAIEVTLICLVAFGTAILTSTYAFFHGSYGSSGRTTMSWVAQSVREISALGLLWYVLTRRNQSFSNLGLQWKWSDIGWSIILFIAGSFASRTVYSGIYLAGLTDTSHAAAHAYVGSILFGGGISVAAVIFQFINPCFEELIARAYFMTEIKLFANSVFVAIIASTVLQTSYHFYQGAPSALSIGAMFLVFSIYYAKTNRIAPLILAHLYCDVGATLSYWLHH
jgi:membrane protease YdiL (CAAX protease family)